MGLCKGGGDYQGEHHGRLCIDLKHGWSAGAMSSNSRWEERGTDLDTVRIGFDLSPTDSLIGPSAGVTAIKLLCRVDVHGALGSISHQTRVGNMMLDETATENDHACSLGPYRDGVDATDILDDVDAQLARGGLEGVEIEHIAQAPISEGRAEDGDVVLVSPVVNRAWVVNLLAKTVDDLARGPGDGVRGVLAGLLLLQELVEDGHDPVLEGAVIAVGDIKIADAIEAASSQG